MHNRGYNTRLYVAIRYGEAGYVGGGYCVSAAVGQTVKQRVWPLIAGGQAVPQRTPQLAAQSVETKAQAQYLYARKQTNTRKP
jgi:hypothetical protein